MNSYEIATLVLAAIAGIGVPCGLAMAGMLVKLLQRVATLEADMRAHAELRSEIPALRTEIHNLGLAIRSLEAKIDNS